MKIKKYSQIKAKSVIDQLTPKNKRQFIKRGRLIRRETLGATFGFLLFLLLLSNIACQTPSLKANQNAAPTTAARDEQDNITSLEKDLETMRNANFDYIFVFRRKDGGAFDGEDKKYLKANSPVFTNRFILTDENKAAIAGSSYKFEPENLESLENRFVIENFSKPETQNSQTENQNAPKNSNRQENLNR